MNVADLNRDSVPDLLLIAGNDDGYGLAFLPGLGNGTFTDPHIQVVEGGLRGMTLADLNGDEFLDVAGSSQDSVIVMFGRGDGCFDDPLTYGTGLSYPSPAASGDLDGDGDLDLVVVWGYEAGVLIVLRNDGNGAFPQHLELDLGHQGASRVVLGDFDGDGRLDAAVTCSYTDEYEVTFSRLLVLRGQGDCTLGNTVAYGEEWAKRFHLTTGDLDGDGHLDLLCSRDEYASDMVEIWRGVGDGTFYELTPLESVSGPGRMVLGDLNTDGMQDLVVTGIRETALHLGNGAGGFLSTSYFPATNHADAVALGDLDGDGDQDAVVTTDMVTVFLGYGDGTFAAASEAGTGDLPLEIDAADFNGDGAPDLAVAIHEEVGDPYYDPDDGGVSVYIGQGNGQFSVPDYYRLGSPHQAVSAADFNGDGAVELALVSTTSDTVSVLPGIGDGSFGTPAIYPTGWYPVDVVAAQLVGDESLDLATANRGDQSVSVLPGLGDGSFAPALTFSAGPKPCSIEAADLDDDGDLDLVAGQETTNHIVVLLNNGDDSFAAPAEYECGDWPTTVTASDLDGDGDLDLATANFVSEDLSILSGNGDGSFTRTAEIPLGIRTYSITTWDLNDDELPELIVSTGDGVTLYFGAGKQSFDGPYHFSAAPFSSLLVEDLNLDGAPDLAATYFSGRKICLINGFPTAGLIATGPGPGEDNPPLIRLFHPGHAGSWTAQWEAYGVSRYGVNVALGDCDGGGEVEVITGAGPGPVFGPHVRGFQADGTPIHGISFFAYATNRWGVNVACGDLDGDGLDEIVSGAGSGPVFGPHVRGWNWDGAGETLPISGVSFLAYGTNRWGVNVACGDVDGDGFDEIVSGAGPGAVFGPHVRGWDWDGEGTTLPISSLSFMAYNTNRWGVNVACGDLDGDGFDEIITGPGPGQSFAPHVRAWNWDGTGSVEAMAGVDFIAYNSARWGVNVVAADLDGDGIAELVTGRGPGPDSPALVRCWNYDGQSVTAVQGMEFFAYDPAELGCGVNVASFRVGESRSAGAR